MLKSLRRHIMMMQQAGGGLPAEYQAVKWLQGDGRAYIVTPINDYYQDIIHFRIKPQGTGAVLGRYEFGLLCYTSFLRCRGGSGGYNYLQIPADEEGFYDIIVEPQNNIATINGVQVALQNGRWQSDINDIKFCLFTRRKSGIVHDTTPSYICGIECITNGVKTYDFRACYSKSDNVAGMYDIVNDVFYTNEGAGAFIVGPDV